MIIEDRSLEALRMKQDVKMSISFYRTANVGPIIRLKKAITYPIACYYPQKPWLFTNLNTY